MKSILRKLQIAIKEVNLEESQTHQGNIQLLSIIKTVHVPPNCNNKFPLENNNHAEKFKQKIEANIESVNTTETAA